MGFVRVAISDPFLFGMLTQGWEAKAKCSKGLPKTAEFVRSYHDQEQGCSYLIFVDESFQEVPDGAKIPLFECEFTTKEA